jgi:hypothetical protein
MITSAELMARSYGHLVASTELLLRLAQASAVYHRMPAGGGRVPELEERLTRYRRRQDYWQSRTRP